MSNDIDGLDWYLLQHKPNSHKIALRNLDRQGFTTFMPLIEETRRASSRFTTRIRPLFPGYIFVALDRARPAFRPINSTYGVSRLVQLGDAPNAVDARIIRDLSERCDATGVLQPAHALAAGDRVQIATGPMSDFVARIEELQPDHRVALLLEFMGQKARLTVPASHLRPA